MNRPAVLKGDDDNDLLALSACYVDCGAGCMHLLGIYLSVCVSIGPQQQTCCYCRFAVVNPPGRRQIC